MLILASTSPRRIDLLRQVGLKPRVLSPHTDETALPGEGPAKLVARLAREKAASIGRPRDCVIAADTIVVAPTGGTILGKPRNRREAMRMLKRLSGRTHTVLTGYCILYKEWEVVRVVRSRVKMRVLSEKQLRAYVETGEPMDKAGAYAAQGIGSGLILEIRGSYTNVVGLPIAQLLSDLETFGIRAI